MSFYERAERAQKNKESKKRIVIYPNRESEIERDIFIEFSECINHKIQDDLEERIERNSFCYNIGMFRRKTDCRYETTIRIYFRYGNVNFIPSGDIFSKGQRIMIFQDSHFNEDYDPNCYNVATCYLSDTKDILFYIFKNLKKDFTNIFIDASWNEYFRESFIDGLRMTRSLIESITDTVTKKVMKKAKDKYGKRILGACFQITVEIPCDKKGNIYL